MRPPRFAPLLLLLPFLLGPALPAWPQDEVVIGRKPLPIDPPLPVDASTALRVVRASGGGFQAIEAPVRPGEAFQVEARFAKPPAATGPLTATVDESPATVTLLPTADPGVYRSAPLAARPAAGALALARTETGYDPRRAARVAAEHFAGEWRVLAATDAGAKRTGVATVAADGAAATLVLRGSGGELRYRSVEIYASVFPGAEPGTTSRRLVIRFEEGAAGAAAPAQLDLPSGRNALRFRYGQAAAQLSVAAAAAGRLRVELHSSGSADRLEGSSSEEREGPVPLARSGRQGWTRGTPRIAGVVVLEDQMAITRPGAVAAFDTMSYPFGPKADPRASTRRTLFIYGEHLPDHGDLADLGSLSPAISYVPAYSSLEQLKQRGWKKAGLAPRGNLTALVVEARLAPGATPGFKGLRVDGAQGEWPLLFNDAQAVLRFVRDSGDALVDATSDFYTSDVAYIELVYFTDVGLRGMNVELLAAGEDGLPLAALPAQRVPDQPRPVFRAGPIHFHDLDLSELSPPTQEGALRVGVRPGMRFSARLQDPAAGVLLPPPVLASIRDDPSGSAWNDAVRRAMACYEEDAAKMAPGPGWTSEPALMVSRRILTEGLRSRNVELKKGDHAAAILVRDEFVEHAKEIAAAYVSASRTPGELRAFRARAIASGSARNEPLWTQYKATYTRRNADGSRETMEVPLWYTLDAEKRAGSLQMAQEAAEPWALEQIRLALGKMNDDMQRSIARAANAGDCALEELLMLVGRDAGAVVARIVPRLVKLAESDDPPRTAYWVPDRLAIGYVKGLHIPAEAARALKEYGAIDDAYKAMALAVVTGGTAALLTRAGAASASAIALIAGDAADIAVFGIRGVLQYREGEAAYEYARGASPVLGLEFLQDAEAGRQSAFFTAVGLIAPALSGAAGVRQLRNVRSIGRGRELLKGAGALDNLARLDDARRADMAAYYTDLLDRARRGGTAALDAADQGALKRFEDYFRAAGAQPPSSARVAASAAEAAASQKRAFQSWKDSLSDESQALLEANPALAEAFASMPRSARRALTRCESPCFPPNITVPQMKRVKALIERLPPAAEDWPKLQAFFHKRADNLDRALDILERAKNLDELRQTLPVPGRMLTPVHTLDNGVVSVKYQVGDSIERAGMEEIIPTRPDRHRAHLVPPGHGVEDPGGLVYAQHAINLGTDKRIDNRITALYKLMKREGRQVYVTATMRRRPNGDILSKTLEVEVSIPGGTPRTFMRIGYKVAEDGTPKEFVEAGAAYRLID